MVEVRTNESLRPPTYAEFKHALHIFKDDLEIAGHPDTPKVSIFQQSPMVSGSSDGNTRQHHLTQLPYELDNDRAETRFLQEFDLCRIIRFSCIDPDASGPSYNIYTNGQNERVASFLMAGGIIQPEPVRLMAIETIAAYLGYYSEFITKVWVTNHNRDCGLITKTLGGGPENTLTRRLGIEPGSLEESQVMKSMILHYASAAGLFKHFGDRVQPALELIDRKGHVGRDLNFYGVVPKSLGQVVDSPALY